MSISLKQTIYVYVYTHTHTPYMDIWNLIVTADQKPIKYSQKIKRKFSGNPPWTSFAI